MQQQKQKYIVPRFHDLALVVLSYGVFEITARQLIIIMLCGLVGLNVFPLLPLGLPLVARVILSGLPSLLLLPFGVIAFAGRPLESWLLVFVRYWVEPRLYTWPQQQHRSLPAAAAQAQARSHLKKQGARRDGE
jgi:hypothetical protein